MLWASQEGVRALQWHAAEVCGSAQIERCCFSETSIIIVGAPIRHALPGPRPRFWRETSVPAFRRMAGRVALLRHGLASLALLPWRSLVLAGCMIVRVLLMMTADISWSSRRECRRQVGSARSAVDV